MFIARLSLCKPFSSFDTVYLYKYILFTSLPHEVYFNVADRSSKLSKNMVITKLNHVLDNKRI